MYMFNSDYLEGAHPLILKALTDTNLIQTPGYGTDDICRAPPKRYLPPARSPTVSCTSW